MAKRTSPSAKKPQPKAPLRDVAHATGFGDMDIGTKVSWISLHVLLFLVPLAISNLSTFGIGGGLPLTFDQFDIIKLFVLRMTTIAALGGWLISLIMRGGKVRFSKVDWLILAFLVWVSITTVTSIHWPTALFGKYRRFEGLLAFINYAAVYFVTVQLVDRPARMRSLMRTLFFSGFLVALYGALQYVGVEPIPYGKLPFETTRSFATYGNPDLLGGFLMFSLPLSVALALSEERTGWRTLYWIGSILNAVVWITAFTRSAWIGGFVGIVALVVAAFRQKLRPKTEDLVMAGVAAAAAAVVIIRSLSAPSDVLNFVARIRSIFQFKEGSALTRFQIWEAAWTAIKDRPIFGFGADTFRLVFPMYKPAAYVAAAGYLSVADNVHNYPLQLATAIGIPGFLILYSIFGWVLVRTFRAAYSTESGGSRILYSGAWAMCLAYVVHLMFGLSVTGTTSLLWFGFGLLMAPTARSIEVRPLSSTVSVIAAILVGLVAATLMVGSIRYVAADHYYMLARVGGQTPDQRVASVKTAIRLNPFNDMYRAELGLSYTDWAFARISGRYGDPATAQKDGIGLLGDAEKALKDAINFVPAEYDNYVFLANLYTTMGSFLDKKYYTDAAAIARKGIAVERYGPAIRGEYARALIGLGNDAEARKQLEYAMKLDPRYAQGALLLAEVYKKSGDLQKALVLLQGTDQSQTGVKEAIQAIEASIAAGK